MRWPEWLAVAVYAIVGLLVSRSVGWQVYDYLERRLEEYGGGEWFPGLEDSGGNIVTSPWGYFRMYALPLLAGTFWLPIAVLWFAWMMVYVWGMALYFLLSPLAVWFFVPPSRRAK